MGVQFRPNFAFSAVIVTMSSGCLSCFASGLKWKDEWKIEFAVIWQSSRRVLWPIIACFTPTPMSSYELCGWLTPHACGLGCASLVMKSKSILRRCLISPYTSISGKKYLSSEKDAEFTYNQPIKSDVTELMTLAITARNIGMGSGKPYLSEKRSAYRFRAVNVDAIPA